MEAKTKKILFMVGGAAAILGLGYAIHKVIQHYRSTHTSQDNRDVLTDATGTVDDVWRQVQLFAKSNGKTLPDSAKTAFYNTYSKIPDAQKPIFLENNCGINISGGCFGAYLWHCKNANPSRQTGTASNST